MIEPWSKWSTEGEMKQLFQKNSYNEDGWLCLESDFVVKANGRVITMKKWLAKKATGNSICRYWLEIYNFTHVLFAISKIEAGMFPMQWLESLNKDNYKL